MSNSDEQAFVTSVAVPAHPRFLVHAVWMARLLCEGERMTFHARQFSLASAISTGERMLGGLIWL